MSQCEAVLKRLMFRDKVNLFFAVSQSDLTLIFKKVCYYQTST